MPMDPTVWHRQRAATCWSIDSGLLRELHNVGDRWWFENLNRSPAGIVVLQIVDRGTALIRRGQPQQKKKQQDEPPDEHIVGPGQAFLFHYGEDSSYGRPPDQPGWPGHREPLETSWLALRGAGLVEHWQLFIAQGGCFDLAADAPLRRMAHAAIAETMHPGREAGAPLRIAALLAELEQVVIHATARGRSPVDRAIDAVLADPWSDLSLKTLAAQSGCSREHLVRQFQVRLGMPPARWLRERRLERAVDLLRETDLPIVAVAKACGAGTAHRLTGWTKQIHGLPPEALRRQLRTGKA
jgi:AraC-like DNA-binding protein